MIITRQKDFNDILCAIENGPVFIIGCSECATMCHTGGEEEVLELKKELEESGVTFHLGTEVNEIEKKDKFHLHTNKGKVEANKLIVSPGRGGAYWFLQQAQKLNLDHNVGGPVDVGVRIEMLAEFYNCDYYQVRPDSTIPCYLAVDLVSKGL